jgi:hypothetical protein
MARTIHEALKLIAGKDIDHARVWNGVGFSGNDSNFGNSLAERDKLTPKMEWFAAKLVRKYRKQVAQITGVCEGLKGKAAEAKLNDFLAALVWEYQETVNKKTVGTISALVGKDTGTVKAFVIRFPYDPQLVAAVRSLPSRRFDTAEKKWIVGSPSDIDKEAIRKLVASGKFELTDGAKKVLAA